MLNLIKKYPSPRFRVSPYVKVDVPTGKILLDPDVKRTVDKLEVMLQHKFEDSSISDNELMSEIED